MVDMTPQFRSKSKPRILTSMQKSQAKNPNALKLLHVSVTVISLSGVYFKESTKSKNTTNGDESQKSIPKTTVVASLAHEEEKEDGAMDDHLRSLPLDFSTSPNPKNATKEIVHWPSSDGISNKNVSTFQFERYFLREKEGRGIRKKKLQQMYASQSCRIQLAVCRNKRWFKLGDADIVVSGEERGEQSISVPLVNKDQPVKKSKNNAIPMARLKGETLKCGLGGNAALRVLVNVSEAPKYDPSIAVVVHKKMSKDEGSSKVVDQAAIAVLADQFQENGRFLNKEAASKAQVQKEERKPEDLQTITSSVLATPSVATNHDSPASKTEIVKVADLPPVPSTSSTSITRHDSLPPIRQSSSSTSRPENILDRILTAANEPSSPKAPLPPQTQSSTSRGFSPISKPLRTLSPFRAVSPLHQSSGNSLSKPSVLDRVVTITSTASQEPSRARSLSEHLSKPGVPKKANGASVYFVEHDMQTSHDVDSSQHASRDINNSKSRSSLTASTADRSTSYMSSVKSSSYRSIDTHSHNSAFTRASGYSSTRDSTRCSTDASSMNSRAEDDEMAIVMAELLEKTPSELYAIIHDEDPPMRKRRKDKQRSDVKNSRGKSSLKVVKQEEEDDYSSEYESEFISAAGTSRSTYHGTFDEESACTSSSESSISFVNVRRNSRSQNCKNLTDKAKLLGRKFICALPICGVGNNGEKTLSYIDDNVSYVNGQEYLLGGRKQKCTDTWIGSSSSSSGRSSVIGSDFVF